MDMIEKVLDLAAKAAVLLKPHSAGILFMLVCMLVGAFMAQRVFTKDAHWKQRPVWFWWWGRKTLPLHPVAAGIVTAIFVSHGPSLAESMLYFAGWGAGSVFAYEALKHLAMKKGIDFSRLPGD